MQHFEDQDGAAEGDRVPPEKGAQELIVAKPSKPPRKVSVVKARRLARLHETAAVGLALGVLTIGYMAWRLSIGTISIAVAKPFVESALDRIVGGQTEIGELRLGWNNDRRDFVVTANKISATTKALAAPMALGQVNLTLNAQALLLGRTEITRADLAGVQAVLVRDKEGRVAFGFGSPEEVLTLPRQKRETTGLRTIMDAVRKALLPKDRTTRVELVALTNAQLIVIDPDTNERLTLNNASATVRTNAKDVVTVQAAGYPLELGGFANLAISAGPEAGQNLVLASVFNGAKLAGLPSSLRVGPLVRFGKDTAPLNGNILVHLDDKGAPLDVRANLGLGPGQFQGVDLSSATGTFVWDSTKKDFKFENLSARGARLNLSQSSGSISALRDGLRGILFQARAFAFDHPLLGALSGDAITGTAKIRADNSPVSANIAGQSISFTKQSRTALQAGRFNIALSSPNARQPSQMTARLSAQSLSGDFEGQRLSSANVNALLEGERRNSEFLPSQVDVTADRFGAAIRVGNAQQDIDFNNLNLVARQFQNQASNGIGLPGAVRFNASSMSLGNAPGAAVLGQMRNIAVEVSSLWTGRARVQGTMASLATSAQGVAATGQTIVFDATQTGPETAQLATFRADNLNLSARQVSVETVGLTAVGTLSPGRFTNTQLTSRSVEVTQPEQLLRPFWADDLRVQGDFGTNGIDLDSFALRHRGLQIAGSTTIERAQRGLPSLNLQADIDGRFSVQTLLAAWPKRLLPETRGSIQRLVPAGNAEVSRLSLALPAGRSPKEILPTSAVDLDFNVDNLTITYLPGMSAVTGVGGHGVLTGSSLTMDLPRGNIGNLALSSGKLDIPQFKPRGAEISIAAQIDGAVVDMANEIDMPPLAMLSKAQLDPGRLSGSGMARLNLDFALQPALTPQDIGVRVSGDFVEAGLTRTFAGIDATDGRVHLEVLDRKTTVTGTAKLADNLFDFTWATGGVNGAGAQTSLTANGDVSIESLNSIGLNLAPYARGPIRIDVQSNTEGSLLGKAVVNADFINTNITLPGNIWTKSEGVEGRASANLFPREGGGWNVQDLRFDSAGTVLRGALDLSDTTRLVDARFSKVVIPGAVDLSVDVTPGLNGLTVTLRGEYLNLSPFLKTQNVSEKAVDLLDRPLTLSADVKRVSTSADNTLTNVHADIVRDLQGWRTLGATGESLAGKSQVQLMVERDGRRTISGVLSDAGFFAQLLYPGAPIFGGTGSIEGELPVVGANSSGSLTFTGKDIRFARPGSTPILFENVRLPMSVRGGVVTLRDGQADGVAYTVKASGYVDVGAGRLDLRGVATPGGLNRVLADIPLFGVILGGGADEGLLGMTFVAKGSLTAPRLRTNPISALAPGFLRKLFESEAPISPQPRLIVTNFAGDPVVTKWPYGPTEDMSENAVLSTNATETGPTQ